MPVNKVNGILLTDINKAMGVAGTSVTKIDSQPVPAGPPPAEGATRVVACFDDAYISWADIGDDTDVTAWEDNMFKAGASGDSWDMLDIAYGKNGSGDPFYVTVANSNNPEILYDDDGDITDGERWQEVNLGSGGIVGNLRQRTVAWGNDVWVTAGKLTSSNQYIYRSTDGSTWSAIDISGLTDIGNVYTEQIWALTSDGEGKWWFGIGGKLYYSSDNASTWALHVTFSGEKIWDLAYTNDTLVALVKQGGNPHLRTAAASDTTDFSEKVMLEDASGDRLAGNNTKRMAAGNGRVVARDTARTQAADVDGKTITIQGTRQNLPDEGNLNCICTDGDGNWWAGSDGGNTGADGGDICKSTDNGLSWTKVVEGINVSGNRKVEGIVADVLLPV
tara:strand:- start:7522 stop:8694 length:1173 start_codon:yes stop_codon:yes gene_type:complete